MSITAGIILFFVGLAVGGGLVWFLKQKELESARSSEEQIKAMIGDLSKQALDQNLDTFLKLAENKFSELVKSSDGQLDQKKELIDQSLVDMKKKLEGLDKSTSELKGQMATSQKGIGDLAETTSQLQRVLSSSQARGQWGERMVEDIINFMGLVEGINFEKQAQAGEGRPDFTFKLPDEKRINMDVKFPLAHYERFLGTDNEREQASEKKAFLKDVRTHVKAIEKRSYIDPEGGTVDYVLMFIPNESIYAFLNQEDRELIDFALSRKVVLCSPITLYAVLSLIRQTASNFAMEQKAGEVQQLVGVFRKQYEKFLEKLDALGKTLGTVSTHYEDLSGTRRRALEKPMDKINELQLGGGNDQKELGE
ncbi:MAG: DNA recombination protein RmuC [Candidatus Marinimicrobia bacterium]|nr:DNA recombination protein RmuC [Candidatus Neomarinimicrobiota bacterium]